MVPTTCARCHSSRGLRRLPGRRQHRPRAGWTTRQRRESVVRCATCHTPAAETLTAVTFPSGAKVTGLGAEATCMTCHQGRASGADVDKVIADARSRCRRGHGRRRPMRVHQHPLLPGGGHALRRPGQGRLSVRRRRSTTPASATWTASTPASAATTRTRTQARWDACATCHPGVKDLPTRATSGMMSSRNRDYDGDGNRDRGHLPRARRAARRSCSQAIARYGVEKNGPLCYGEHASLLVQGHQRQRGHAAPRRQCRANGYKRWTPRLPKAAFNYQMASKDPGAFAHNAKYIMQLLYDSTTDVNERLVVKIDLARPVRGDPATSTAPARPPATGTANEAVHASCSRCHSGQRGFRFFVAARRQP